jgi:hypothetical protein
MRSTLVHKSDIKDQVSSLTIVCRRFWTPASPLRKYARSDSSASTSLGVSNAKIYSPVAKHNGSRGISSLAEVVYVHLRARDEEAYSRYCRSTDHFKPAHLIPDMMVDPNWCMSEDPKLAPSPRAYGVDGIFWHIC